VGEEEVVTVDSDAKGNNRSKHRLEEIASEIASEEDFEKSEVLEATRMLLLSGWALGTWISGLSPALDGSRGRLD
jgi:hypothetical protein